MPLLPVDDRDNVIGRVRFAGVGRPDYRKRVRSEDRYEDRVHHKGTVCFHAKSVPVRSIGCYDASGGFFGTTEGGSAIPSSEIDCDLCCVILKLCSSGRRRIGNVPRADRTQMCICTSLFPSLPELIEGQERTAK